MNEHRKKVVTTLVFAFILIGIALLLTAYLPYTGSVDGIPPILPAFK
ncbi:MAG: hypothetical protein RL094_675 [Candidatus Parcubacteria bacterium]|jgi:predicted secreted protein